MTAPLEAHGSASPSFKVVIPARFGSSRLPGKPLLDIAGKPMIWHVVQRAIESGACPDSQIFVATDDERIMSFCSSAGIRCVMTSAHHQSGTERLAEVAQQLNWSDETVVVNLQGDEPLMPPALIYQVAENLFMNTQAGIATLSTPITSIPELFDPNVVKVVTKQNGTALYFSRAAIPWNRDEYPSLLNDSLHSDSNLKIPAQRHLGLYAYRVKTLKQLAITPMPLIESHESLEQLRALWLGVQIHVQAIATPPSHGVDTLADLEYVRQHTYSFA